MNKFLSYLFFLLALVCLHTKNNAQENTKPRVSLKDTLDHQLDLSDYILEAHGFIPVPYIITEPALGGFGGAIAPIFLNKNPPIIDTLHGRRVVSYTPPTITGGMFAYTLNDTWVAAVFRSGIFMKPKIKYTVFAGYASANLSFYREFPSLGEKEFKFNLKGIPAMLQVTKRIAISKWYVGLKYMYQHAELSYKGEIPAFFTKPIEFNSTISQGGVVLELDSRDNVFTPNKGMKLHVDGNYSAPAIGSDYTYWRINYYAYLYKTFFERLTMGWRIDGQQTFDTPPFYLLPFIDMRGIPAARYQGNADLLTELEARFDVVPRWSIMLFGGTGKAFNEWEDFPDANWVYSYGTGFRYLIARKFKLRMGVDVAKGPDSWGYYIVFGSNWLK